VVNIVIFFLGINAIQTIRINSLKNLIERESQFLRMYFLIVKSFYSELIILVRVKILILTYNSQNQ